MSEQTKKLILGLEIPKQSIADSGKLKSIQKENQYLPLSISFLDFEELMKLLFQEKNNPWLELLGDEQPIIANLQASECEADVMTLVKDVPGMFAGYKAYQVRDQRINMNFEVLLELKNENVKTELNYFRGFIPDSIRSGAKDNILAFGLGANMSQLSPMFVYISRALRESHFTCPELIKIQQEVAQFNPAMLALVTGVVDGVHGISFALQNFKLAKPPLSTRTSVSQAQVDLSMILSLAAEEPLKVWQMLSAFVPEMAMITPSEKPQKLSLPDLNALGVDVFAVIEGSHLALYTGHKAAAISERLVKEQMVTNGFFYESMSYTKLTNAIEELRDYMASSEGSQTLPAETCIYIDESIAMLSRISGFIDFQSDFVSSGWLNAMTADIALKQSSKKRYQLPGKFETFYVQDGCQLAIDGFEEILEDGTGIYQQFSDDGQCFIFETRYRWAQEDEKINLHYVSERSRPDGLCANEFKAWAIPATEYINDVCQLRNSKEGDFSCVFQWDDVLTKSVYKRI